MARRPAATPAAETYTATLTKTVKIAGEFHAPGTVLDNVSLDLAAELDESGAAVIAQADAAASESSDSGDRDVDDETVNDGETVNDDETA